MRKPAIICDFDSPENVTQNRSGAIGRDGDVLKPVHDQAVVDLIGEDDELMLARDIDDLLQAPRAGRAHRSDCSD